MSTGNVTRLKHGGAYSSWENMKRRCYSPTHDRYANYGGRGIRVCSRWLNSFTAFFIDMGPRPPGCTLERKNNDGDYCKNNCVWATNTEQCNNKSNNVSLTHNGRTMTKAAWAKELGVSRHFLQTRLARGWSVEAALSSPVRSYKKGIA